LETTKNIFFYTIEELQNELEFIPLEIIL